MGARYFPPLGRHSAFPCFSFAPLYEFITEVAKSARILDVQKGWLLTKELNCHIVRQSLYAKQ
jgi:hypothetical protein